MVITEKENERARQAYYTKAFMNGNSLAVRIPKNIADEAGIKEGTELKVSVKDRKIIIEAVS